MKIGLILPQAPQDGDGGSWRDIARLARLADDGGADSLWVCDHFLDRSPDREVGYHEPFTLLAAIAATTHRVALGPLVAATSFRSVGSLAKIASTLDSIAGGRLILGLGCGWHEPEYAAFGYPFDHRVGRFEEVLTAVRALLDGERVTMPGRWLQLDDAVVLPRPERRIPIAVAAVGPRMLSLAARHADAWQGQGDLPGAGFREQRARLLEACDAMGRTDPIELMVNVEILSGPGDGRHPVLEPASIAAGLDAWAAEGIDHVQLGVVPATAPSFEIALEGIHRHRR